MDQQAVVASVFEAFVDDDDVRKAIERLALVEDVGFAHFIGLVFLYHKDATKAIIQLCRLEDCLVASYFRRLKRALAQQNLNGRLMQKLRCSELLTENLCQRCVGWEDDHWTIGDRSVSRDAIKCKICRIQYDFCLLYSVQ